MRFTICIAVIFAKGYRFGYLVWSGYGMLVPTNGSAIPAWRVLAERVNKRNIMVGLDFATAVLITIFYVSLGKLPIVPLFVLVLMILYEISGTYQPSVQASVPLLVKEDNTLRSNAVINQISSIASLLGPIIGGKLFGAWGINLILIVSIVCFALSAVMEIFIHIPFQKRTDKHGMLRSVKII